MKKVLSLVLALAMVLGSFSFVSAAPMSDVTDPTLKKAVDRLSLLEVLTGYPDGTFKPGQTITRAEFAAVAVRVKGLAEAANAAKGLSTGFNDVTAAHWASGFVGTAAKLGIVNGVGNGLFAPEAPVKYEEAITMIVRALGYEAEAQTKGGYPYGYLIVANDRGLLDDVKGTQGMPASRGIVAQITDNALEIPKMIQVGFGSETKWVVSGSKEHGSEAVAQLLLHDLGVDEIKGIVSNNFRTKGTIKADEIEIEVIVENEKARKYEITEDVDVDSILGTGVTAWAKDDVIFSVSVGYNFRYDGDKYIFEEDQIIYDAVVNADGKEDTTEKQVKLKVLDDEYDWADGATVYVNNTKVPSSKFDEIVAGTYGRFVLNEDDDVAYAYLFEIESDDFGITTAIDKDELEFINAGADEDVLALDDAKKIYVFNRDLSAGSLEDIKEDTAVFFWVDSDDDIYYIIASNEVLEGTLEAVRLKDARVTVAGKNITAKTAIFSSDDGDEYVQVEADFAKLEDYVDEDVVVYYDLKGDALAIVTGAEATSGKIYGIATWITEARNPQLSVVSASDEEVEYTFEKRSEATSLFNRDFGLTITGVNFKVDKDGEIQEGTFVPKTAEVTFEKNNKNKYGEVSGTKYYITEDTVILQAFDNDDEFKPSVIKYDDIIKKDIAATKAIIMTDKGNDLTLLIFTQITFEGTDNTEYGILTSDPSVRSNGNYRASINVAGLGEETYTIKGITSATQYKTGDMIEFKLNAKGEVTIIDTVKLNKDNVVIVEKKDGSNYIDTVSGTTYRRTADTLVYKVDKYGDFDGTSSFTRIAEGSKVLMLLNDKDEIKAIVDFTLQLGKAEL